MLHENDSRAGHPLWTDNDVYTGEPREQSPMTKTLDFPNMADIVPATTHGAARVEHFTVSKDEAAFHNMRCDFGRDRYGYITPGTYARLIVRGQLFMSDTPMERRTNGQFLRAVNGHALVAGLGLGMIVHGALGKREVKSITVVEKEPDVIGLVAPTLAKYGNRVRLVEADITTWKPEHGSRFDTIYFDIWGDISTDDLATMARLHRRFSRYLNRENPKAWMSSWRVDTLRAQRDDARRSGW